MEEFENEKDNLLKQHHDHMSKKKKEKPSLVPDFDKAFERQQSEINNKEKIQKGVKVAEQVLAKKKHKHHKDKKVSADEVSGENVDNVANAADKFDSDPDSSANKVASLKKKDKKSKKKNDESKDIEK